MAKPVTQHQNQIIIGVRDFSAELQAAREAQDWVAHAQIWEDRRCADVETDEAMLRDQASVDEEAAFQEYQASQSDPALIASELRADIGRPAHCPEAYEEMARHDAEGRS